MSVDETALATAKGPDGPLGMTPLIMASACSRCVGSDPWSLAKWSTRSLGWRQLAFKCRPARHGHWPAPSSLDQGQTFSSLVPHCSVASCPPKYCSVALMLVQLPYAQLRPFSGGGCGAAFGTTLATASTGKAGRTGSTMGSCGRFNIPSAGNCRSTHRRHALAYFPQSHATVQREVENAPSHGAIVSAMTRQKAFHP